MSATLSAIACEWDNCPLDILEYVVKPFMAPPYAIYEDEAMDFFTTRIRNIIFCMDGKKLSAFDVLTGNRRELLDDCTAWFTCSSTGSDLSLRSNADDELYFPKLDQFNEPNLNTLEFKVRPSQTPGNHNEHFQHIKVPADMNRGTRLYESGAYAHIPGPARPIICGKNTIDSAKTHTMIHVPRQRYWHVIIHDDFEQRIMRANETSIIYDETVAIAGEPRVCSSYGYVSIPSEGTGDSLIIPIWEADP